jgi:hypothetical protein
MRRARIIIALVTLAVAFYAADSGRAASGVTRMSGIGVLDYTRKPTFKVGDYVRYRVTTADQEGSPQDTYVMTVMIAAQDVWWGERCFYLETWVDNASKQENLAATLMSYSIFEDSSAEENVKMYMRKMVMGFNEDGSFDEKLMSAGSSALSTRQKPREPRSVSRDTLGADTVQTPMGTLRATKVVTHISSSRNSGRGDSASFREVREDRAQWICNDVPMTSFALEETRSTETRRAWLIGRSKDSAPVQVVSAGTVTARLIGFGHGLRSRALPADRIRSFDDPPPGRQRAPAGRPRPAAGGVRRP